MKIPGTSNLFTKKKAAVVVQTAPRRLLTLQVLEAKGIIGCNRNGTSDSYAVCALLDLGEREIKKETFISQPKNGTVTPQYGETFVYGQLQFLHWKFPSKAWFLTYCTLLILGNTYDLNTSEELPSIRISLFHKGSFGSDTPLGEITIPLDSVDASGQTTYDKWRPLKISGRMKSVSGEVRVTLKFSGPPGHSDGGDSEETSLLHSEIEDYKEDPDAEEMVRCHAQLRCNPKN